MLFIDIHQPPHTSLLYGVKNNLLIFEMHLLKIHLITVSCNIVWYATNSYYTLFESTNGVFCFNMILLIHDPFLMALGTLYKQSVPRLQIGNVTRKSKLTEDETIL